MKHYVALWIYMGLYDTQWNSLKPIGAPWHSIALGIWESMELFAALYNCMVLYGAPWDSKEALGHSAWWMCSVRPHCLAR